MSDTATTLFVLRDEVGNAVGMGALKVHGEEMAEVKRMYTRSGIRGKGGGRLILDAVENIARRKGIKKLMLETGATKGFEPAWRIYERSGFTSCDAFLDYPASEFSRFYEKQL